MSLQNASSPTSAFMSAFYYIKWMQSSSFVVKPFQKGHKFKKQKRNKKKKKKKEMKTNDL